MWSKAHQLTLAVYRVTQTFPPDEKYGLTSQLRRSTASIPTNIAEGAGRDSPTDYARFLTIAAGSASEVEYLILLSRDLTFITSTDAGQLTADVIAVRKMLYAYIRKLHQPHAGGAAARSES